MKALRIIALLGAVQLGLWFAWRALTAPEAELPHFAGPRPAITVYGPDDRPAPLPDGPYVLHIWATWCPPCRVELPGLLDFAARASIPVLAVATDPDWQTIRGFTGDPLSPALRRTDGRALADRLDVGELPVTFVVGRHGMRARIDGAREWHDPALREAVSKAAR